MFFKKYRIQQLIGLCGIFYTEIAFKIQPKGNGDRQGHRLGDVDKKITWRLHLTVLIIWSNLLQNYSTCVNDLRDYLRKYWALVTHLNIYYCFV